MAPRPLAGSALPLILLASLAAGSDAAASERSGAGLPGVAETPTSAGRYRAHYEIELRDTDGTYSIGTGGDLQSGLPLTHEVSRYRLVLRADIDGERYALTVAVSRPLQTLGQGIELPSSWTVQGRIGAPLEFTTELAGAKVSGAMMISALGGAR